eukprot:361604-Chlamydomonas_euryale.AAC.5
MDWEGAGCRVAGDGLGRDRVRGCRGRGFDLSILQACHSTSHAHHATAAAAHALSLAQRLPPACRTARIAAEGALTATWLIYTCAGEGMNEPQATGRENETVWRLIRSNSLDYPPGCRSNTTNPTKAGVQLPTAAQTAFKPN